MREESDDDGSDSSLSLILSSRVAPHHFPPPSHPFCSLHLRSAHIMNEMESSEWWERWGPVPRGEGSRGTRLGWKELDPITLYNHYERAGGVAGGPGEVNEERPNPLLPRTPSLSTHTPSHSSLSPAVCFASVLRYETSVTRWGGRRWGCDGWSLLIPFASRPSWLILYHVKGK